MNCVIDLAGRQPNPAPMPILDHPAGVHLPLGGHFITEHVVPESRTVICSDRYRTEMIARLSNVLEEGNHVLMIGSALGSLSTMTKRNDSAPGTLPTVKKIGLRPRAHPRQRAYSTSEAVLPYLKIRICLKVRSWATQSARQERVTRMPQG